MISPILHRVCISFIFKGIFWKIYGFRFVGNIVVVDNLKIKSLQINLNVWTASDEKNRRSNLKTG